MRQVAGQREFDLQVVLENVHSAHNASAVIRTCDGFGVAVLNLVYTDTVFPKLSDSVAASTLKWLKVRKFPSFGSCLNELHGEKIKVYGTTLDDNAKNYLDIDWRKPCAVVFGNESSGISPAALELCDEKVRIPMYGMAQSFNISVAAAIILSEVRRQRGSAKAPETVLNRQQQQLLDEWIRNDTTR